MAVINSGNYSPVIDGVWTQGASATINTGKQQVNGVAYGGAAISFTDSADIDNPTWVDVCSISGIGMFDVQVDRTANGPLYLCRVCVDTAEGVGDALRFRVVRDGTTIADAKVVRDVAVDQIAAWRPMMSTEASTYSACTPIRCSTSFAIQIAREGTFADSFSRVDVGSIYYRTIEAV